MPHVSNVDAADKAATFAIDEGGRVVAWSKEAETLLGYRAKAVLGKNCHEILRGSDLFGNRFCDRSCALHCMAGRHEPVRRFELEVRARSGEVVPVDLSITVEPGSSPSAYTIVHHLRRVDRHREADMLLRLILSRHRTPGMPEPNRDDSPRLATRLTPREIQVLRMLANGAPTPHIATTLCISVTTTRNHVQNILNKLEVHSKVAAVSLAHRANLL